jgi:predicted transposase YbfD/YdcC
VQRRLQATPRLAGRLNWPALAQVCRLVRTTWRDGQRREEIEYAITSVPRAQADAACLLNWWRKHWGIENRLHYVRDVTFGEDASRIRTAQAPQNLAALRNAAISLLRFEQQPNIAAALRQHAWQPQRLFAKLGLVN